MPRRAIGHGRAVTAPAAVRVAGRAVGARDIFQSAVRVCTDKRMARTPIANP